MKFSIYQHSRQGPRPYNEDRLAYSYSRDAMLMVVADGMGGHRNGEIAAQLAVKTLTDAFQRLAVPILASPAKFLTDQIQLVHEMIAHTTAEKQLIESPRTTVVAAIVQRGVLYCAHVGDSRMYLYRNGHLLHQTEDHSIVQALFRKGHISREEMADHPYRNKIYNCLGGDTPPQIELSDKHELIEGDTVLLCTDGVWGVLTDQQIKETLQFGSISEATSHLLDMAEENCGDKGDNMSAMGFQWGDRSASKAAVSTLKMPLNETTTILSPTTSSPTLLIGQEGVPAMSDDDIERTIAEIQAALLRSKRKP